MVSIQGYSVGYYYLLFAPYKNIIEPCLNMGLHYYPLIIILMCHNIITKCLVNSHQVAVISKWILVGVQFG